MNTTQLLKSEIMNCSDRQMDIYNTILCDLVQTRRTELQCYLLVLVPKPESSNISIKPGVTTDSRKNTQYV